MQRRALKTCLIVETEVEFVQLYEDQPLFADVDQLLRGQGFMFHRFSSLHGGTFKPMMPNPQPGAPIGQTLWSDAIYVPDLGRLDHLESPALIKLAVLLHEVYLSFDLSHFVLAAHDRRFNTAYGQRYLELFRVEQEKQP